MVLCIIIVVLYGHGVVCYYCCIVGPWSSECGVSWIADHLTGRCYFFSEELVSWQDARKACVNRGSDLLSVRDKAEQTYIQGMYSHLYGDTCLCYFISCGFVSV